MSTTEEADRIWKAVGTVSDRISNLESTVGQREAVMREVIHSAVADAMPSALLTDEQLRWVELAIQKEAQSIRFRQAVIEKTLVALILFVVGGLCTTALALLREYAIAHGMWKP